MAISVPTTSSDYAVGSNVATPGTVSFTKPANVTSGDLLLAAVFGDGSTGTAATVVTPPAGWSAAGEWLTDTTTGYPVGGVYYKIAGGSEGSTYDFSLTDPGSAVGNAFGLLWRATGVDSSTPMDATATVNNQSSTSAPNGPAITTVTDNAVVFSVVALGDGRNITATDSNGPSGYTTYLLRAGSNSSASVSIGVAFKAVTTAGSEDPAAWTSAFSAGAPATSMTLAVRPSGAAAVTAIPVIHSVQYNAFASARQRFV